MDYLHQEGFRSEVNKTELLRAVGVIAGMRQETRTRYVQWLIELRFITRIEDVNRTGNGEEYYAVNYNRMFELSGL